MRAALATLAAIAAGPVLLGCGGEQESQAAATADEPRAGCGKRTTVARVEDFADALRTADLAALKVYWGDRFKWFSVTIGSRSSGTRDHFVAYKPKNALRYIREQNGLPMRLTDVKPTDKSSRSRGAAVEGRWGARRKIFGKTDLICSSPQVRVWSMGVNPPGLLSSK